MLTKEQKDKFSEEGYLIIPGFSSPEEVEKLKNTAHELLSGFNPTDHPLTKFTTGEDEEHVGDSYFLDSGDKVRFFLETEAVKDGKLCVLKNRAVNKIGHGLHGISPSFREFSTSERVCSLARDLGFSNPAILQSMLIFKQPQIGGPVPPHQDSTFLYTEPLSATGLWLALEDCTLDNGYLSFYPGSHKNNPVNRRFVRVVDSTDKEVIKTSFIGDEYTPEQTDKSHYKPALISAGTLVVIHGSVLHKSEPNFSDKSRLAYTFHMIDNQANYPKDNWLQPTPEMPFTVLY